MHSTPVERYGKRWNALTVTATDLDSIRVLYRQDDTMTLWGIPYGMRPGQSPRDLQRAGNAGGWIYLGGPGWWGTLDADSIVRIKIWLTVHADDVPTGPCEFDVI